ncbi:MAG: insulinase family protein [Bacteroidetes bacterium]|nr:insulinase family protein [Bacteroidota bacterium]
MQKRFQLKSMVLVSFMLIFSFILSAQKVYKFETIKGDPLKTRIYTLENGLKVYLSVYKDAPRIQANIAVRVGSKNDPKETTGLAHYFEHLMFKGTPDYGTTDWAKEEPMIAQIEALFEKYRFEKDANKRTELYHQIDSISYEASKIAIPNEYVKLMKIIGSQGTNAATSNDYTVYVENIPSNEIENWAIIQADRFSHPVLRLFHTELETVYEEKNMSLTNDGRKASEAMLSALFPNHPYGTQTTLGETEHLKNPSMKNIREFFAKYYVSNNMAVIMAGDFNPDEVIKIIDKNLGKLKPGNPPALVITPEKPILSPVVKEVVGLESENVRLAWRFGGSNTKDALMIDMLSKMLDNGKAGLIDINIQQKQKTMSAGAYPYQMADYSAFVLSGSPKAGQTLDEVKDLLLQQLDSLKQGKFSAELIQSSINNLKLRELKRLESNNSRVDVMSRSFINGIPWTKAVNYINELGKVTKAELVDFANKNLNNNYVIVYKRQGKPADVAKVVKPKITPIYMNRNAESDFLKKIRDNAVKEIGPVFVDYQKDLTIQKFGNTRILYKTNTENNTFNLYYYFKMGSNNDLYMDLAINYLNYLGTSKRSLEDINREFYKLACNFSVSSSDDETTISISGLSENMEKALSLVEEILADPKPDQKALDNLVNDILKSRKDAKSNQQSNFRALNDYATYGEKSPTKYFLKADELKAIKADELVRKIKGLCNYSHEILYYGTLTPANLTTLLTKYHKLPASFVPYSLPVKFVPMETTYEKIFFANYDSKQSYVQTISKGVLYNEKITPYVNLYNAYFGGSMNAIVFQELREKRSLAYTARSSYQTPSDIDKNYMNIGFIATQNDKVIDAINAYNDLFNNMPESENAFKLSKDAIISKIKTERITKMGIMWNYLNAQKFGQTYDIRKDIYAITFSMSLNDVKQFNNNYIKNRPKSYVILGKEADMKFDELDKIGNVKKLSQEDIFGY